MSVFAALIVSICMAADWSNPSHPNASSVTGSVGGATHRRTEISPTATDLGWSQPELLQVLADAEMLGTAALLIVADGELVLAYGDLSRNYRAHSIRKSFLSALIGIYVENGQIKLSSVPHIDDRAIRLAVRQQRS